MKPTNEPLKEHKEDQLALERLVFFSDAVYAIAITILVLDLRLPAGAEFSNSRELFDLLGSLWPRYLAFFVSFWVIGLSWISHNRKYLHITRVDNRLRMLNLLTLMMIVFIPFPTAVMSETANFASTAFYSTTMVISSLAGLAPWWYATSHHRLVDPRIPEKEIRREFLIPLVTIGVFVVSMIIGAFSPGIARLFWVMAFPVIFILRRRTE